MTARRFLAMAMAAFLAYNFAQARPVALGVVVEANRAHLNPGSVSDGATVYDGDHFSTGTGGVLVLRGEGTFLELAAESELLLRRLANGAPVTEAELAEGTLVFRSSGSAALEVVADEARVRSAGEVQTTGQVRVIGPKELLLYARRGWLQFSYRGETEMIGEGKSYRVMLDPVDDDPQKKGPVRVGRNRRTFLLVAISAGAVGAVAAFTRIIGTRRLRAQTGLD